MANTISVGRGAQIATLFEGGSVSGGAQKATHEVGLATPLEGGDKSSIIRLSTCPLSPP